jgi:hypothetical protein
MQNQNGRNGKGFRVLICKKLKKFNKSFAQGQKVSSAMSTNIKKKKKRKRYRDEYKSLKNLQKNKKRSGRICRICGKDPYPNYFFCPSCHHKVGILEDL